MGVRVAYGKRDHVTAAINNGVIPIDSIIIAKDDDHSAGLMFYDKSSNLIHIVAKTKFASMEEAFDYAAVKGGVGTVVTALDGDKYSAYIVQPGGELEPIGGGVFRRTNSTICWSVSGVWRRQLTLMRIRLFWTVFPKHR